MGFIANIGELNSAKTYVDYLESEISNAAALNGKLSDFVSSVEARELIGELWNATSDKVNKYKALNNQRRISISNFKNVVNGGLDTLISAWDPDFGDEVSDSKIAELEAEIIRLQALIAELYTHLMREVTYTDAEGNTTTVLEEDPVVREAIDQATNELNRIILLLRKIKKYKELNNTVVSNIEAAFADVVTFAVGAENIQPTPLWSYESFIGN